MVAAERNGTLLQDALSRVAPQVAAVYQQGDQDGFFWVAMEYGAGTDLTQVVEREAPLDEQRAVSIALQLCEMLETFHEFSTGVFFFSSRRRHTSWNCDWSSDVCSSDLEPEARREASHVHEPVERVEIVRGAALEGDVGEGEPARALVRDERAALEVLHLRNQIGRASCRERV